MNKEHLLCALFLAFSLAGVIFCLHQANSNLDYFVGQKTARHQSLNYAEVEHGEE